MRSPLVWLVLVATLVGTIGFRGAARAATAVVAVREGVARAAPDHGASVVHVFPPSTPVYVSGDAVNGWRRVAVPGGQIAFIRESEVEISAGASPPIVPIAPVAAPPAMEPTLPARYVDSLGAIAEVTRSDSLLHPRAQSLANRRTAGRTLTIGGTALGTLVAILGAASAQNCRGPSAGPSCTPSQNTGVIGVGAAIMLSSALAGLAIAPSHGEMVSIVNDWNARHPTQPISVLPPMTSRAARF